MYEMLLLSGLTGRETLVATRGLQVPGVRVIGRTRVSPNAYRLLFATPLVGPAPVFARANGKDLPATLGRAVTVTTPPGGTLDLALRDDPTAWPAFQFPARINVQWEAVPGAERYEVRDAGGTLIDVVKAVAGRQYYLWDSPMLCDGDDVTYNVNAVSPSLGASGAAASVSVTVVTTPIDPIDATFAYNGDLTVDAT